MYYLIQLYSHNYAIILVISYKILTYLLIVQHECSAHIGLIHGTYFCSFQLSIFDKEHQTLLTDEMIFDCMLVVGLHWNLIFFQDQCVITKVVAVEKLDCGRLLHREQKAV